MDMHWFSSQTVQSPSATFIAAGLVVILVLYSARAQGTLRKSFRIVLSHSIGRALRAWYPVHHFETGQALPTCPYQWPNGQGDVAKFLEGLSKSKVWGSEYGSIYRIWSGTNPEVVLTRAKHVQEVFRDSHRHQKAPNNNSGYFMGEILGSCLGLISGEAWMSVKEVVEPPFLRNKIQDHMDVITRRTQSYLSSPQIISKLKTGRIDPVMDFKMLPFWIVAEILFGELDSDLEDRLAHLTTTREELFQQAISGGLVRFKFSPWLIPSSFTKLRRFQAEWKSILEGIQKKSIRDRRAPVSEMFDAVEENKLTEKQLLQTLDEMLFANLDVTMGAISWNLVLLATNPEEQDRLLQEIHNHKGDLSAYMLSASTFLAACILESARIKPLAAFSVPQAAPSDRKLNGFVIPAGTSFIIDTQALNMNEEFWGTNSSTYYPARFLEKPVSTTRYNYWRFGFGPRQCLGKYVADVMIRCLLVQLIREWKLEDSKRSTDWHRIDETWISQPKGQLKATRR